MLCDGSNPAYASLPQQDLPTLDNHIGKELRVAARPVLIISGKKAHNYGRCRNQKQPK
jgi:hypothetical protein